MESVEEQKIDPSQQVNGGGVTTKYAGAGQEGKLLIPLSSILIDPERMRKSFDDIQGLAQSIWSYGLFAPLVVVPAAEGKFLLIAGGRRYRALMILAMKYGLTHVHCNLFGDLDAVQQREIELEENLRRKQFEPFEEIEGLRILDESKRKLYGDKSRGTTAPGWTINDTALAVNQDTSTVNKKIKLARQLKADPTLKARVQHLPISAAIKEVQKIQEGQRVQRLHDAGELKTVNMMIHGDAVLELQKLKSCSIDLVIIDPPYGIGNLQDAVGKGGISNYTAVLKNDDNMTLENSLLLLADVIPELSRVMKPSAHIYIFHAHDQREDIITMLDQWDFIHHPDQIIIWNKGKTTAPFMGKKFASCYEPIIFAAKAPGEKNLSEPEKLIIDCSVVRDGKIHSFQKPQELLCRLIKLSSKLGDTVLDCFAGSGSTVRAAVSMGRSAIGIEKDKEHWNLAQGFLGASAIAVEAAPQSGLPPTSEGK